jgi:hypothetical protein
MAGKQIQNEVMRGFGQFAYAHACFLVTGDGAQPLRGTVGFYFEDIQTCWHAGEDSGRYGEKAVQKWTVSVGLGEKE